jgi:hypothetical protein
VKYILVQYMHLLILRDCNETHQFVICADGNLLGRYINSVVENTVVLLDTRREVGLKMWHTSPVWE